MTWLLKRRKKSAMDQAFIDAGFSPRPPDHDLTGWIVDEEGADHCHEMVTTPETEYGQIQPQPEGYESPKGIAWESATFRFFKNCTGCGRRIHQDRSMQI